MQCKHMQLKTSKRQESLHMRNHVSTSTQKQNHTQMQLSVSGPVKIEGPAQLMTLGHAISGLECSVKQVCIKRMTQ